MRGRVPWVAPGRLVWLLFTVLSQFPSCSLSEEGSRLRGFEVNGCFYFFLLESGQLFGSRSIVPHRILVRLEGSLSHTYPRVHQLGLMLGMATGVKINNNKKKGNTGDIWIYYFFGKSSSLAIKGPNSDHQRG